MKPEEKTQNVFEGVSQYTCSLIHSKHVYMTLVHLKTVLMTYKHVSLTETGLTHPDNAVRERITSACKHSAKTETIPPTTVTQRAHAHICSSLI